MNRSSQTQVLSAAALRILRPLVRILLRHGVSYGTFADLAKWVYVDVAEREFPLEGRKQSTSRVSILTGLSRKEVSRVSQLPRPDDAGCDERYNRAARVIGAWLREPDFAAPDGKPAVLPLEGEGASFAELVKRFSGDVPARAILDELIRSGSVELSGDDAARLIAHAYVPANTAADKIHILGTDVQQLISTIDHNIDSGEQPFYQRKVMYDNLPDEVLGAFRDLTNEECQAILEHFNKWLAERDRDTNPAVQGTGRNQAGVGIFYFEAPYDDEDTES